MRIFFINRYFGPDQSATSRMTTSLASALASTGWAVHVIASRHLHDDPRASLPALAMLNGVTVHRVPSSRFDQGSLLGRLLDYLSFCFAASWRLWRLSTRGDVVVAGTDPPLFPVCAALVSRVNGTRLVNWLQDLFPEVATALGVTGLGGLVGRGLRALRDFALRHAESNVVPGSSMACHLEQRGISAACIRVRHNWSDGVRVRPIPPAMNPLRREWGLLDRFVAGYSGNMGRAHDFATIIAAARALRERSDIVFLLIGEGYYKPWIEAQIADGGLTNVVLKPLQPEARLGEGLGLPDVHLISLRPELEGFVVPSKFYGAAAAGRPVLFIGDADGEVGRLVSSGSCGAAVPVGHHAALCEWILRLQQRPELCAAWGRNARALFEARFEQKRAFAAWEEMLLGVGAERRAAIRAPAPAWAAPEAAASPSGSDRPQPVSLPRGGEHAPAEWQPG